MDGWIGREKGGGGGGGRRERLWCVESERGERGGRDGTIDVARNTRGESKTETTSEIEAIIRHWLACDLSSRMRS